MKKPTTFISVQEQDFDLALEYTQIRKHSDSDGAIVTFTGLVRELTERGNLKYMTLEHYPGMTEKSLMNICEQARERWPIGSIRIIHRIGKLPPDEQIVFVGVSSKHRKAAFAATEFMMDFLKTQAPFWKKELTTEGEFWVDAKSSDKHKANDWLTSN
ncbi:molybdopterin synthase catalytic subunit MoaE [Brumicola nitratireducens]|uniref:Molybdopterin synthase catalytic subunit n=1 Tax=Glaciecola nitratireducens (strain JCM 12485 / KCTC 12276 / FR1064) TaxID=1085623 RepID=G4QKH1_GLANF|nr:molybdopterin synthase catalytic subunit MoaE [Glaciecola nitratireducens]AEP30037.1 molybdenum cofactor biosynthesis protein E [Glaciecola nitratireducens FR1064]